MINAVKIIVICVLCVFCACRFGGRQDGEKGDAVIMPVSDSQLQLSLRFMPPSVLKTNKEYLIEVLGDTLTYYNYGAHFDVRQNVVTYRVKLNNSEIMMLEYLTARIKESYSDTTIGEKRWTAQLSINGTEVYDDSNYSNTVTPKSIRELITYLFQIIPFRTSFDEIYFKRL